MSNIEQKAKPILLKLMKGQIIVLGNSDIEIVARWIALKSMILEHAHRHRPHLTPAQDRLEFMKSGKIPDYFQIYLANHGCWEETLITRNLSNMNFDLLEDWKDGAIENSLGDNSIFNDPHGEIVNLQQITWIMGRAVVHVNAAIDRPSFIEDFIIYVDGLYDVSRIWPNPPGTVAWPRLPNLSPQDIWKLVTIGPGLVQKPNFRWRIQGMNPFWLRVLNV